MNKCAFIIPLHPKHYQYGYSILNEISGSDADLYFVFTTVEDKDLFEKELPTLSYFRYILFSAFTPMDPIVLNSIVSLKKWYALALLYTKYEYICTIDSEIKFLKKTGFYKMMQSIALQKMIFGGRLPPEALREQSIVRDSLLILTPTKDHAKLGRLSNQFRMYTWWSNPAVYVCKDVPGFFNWIDFRRATLNRFVWNIFDDMVYNFYCILYKGYQLKEIPVQNSLEFAPSEKIEFVNNRIGRIYWVNYKSYQENTSYYKDRDFYIIFHLDRV